MKSVTCFRCDAKWLPIADDNNAACVASPPGDDGWLHTTTDKGLAGLCWPPNIVAWHIEFGGAITHLLVVQNSMALCFVAASVAATRQVQDMMELVTSLPKGDAESTSVAMGALVSLERVMRLVKADWGIAVIVYFAFNFIKALCAPQHFFFVVLPLTTYHGEQVLLADDNVGD